MDIQRGRIGDLETVSILPSPSTNLGRIVVYHTGGGESADVLADPGNEKCGIFSGLSRAGYPVTSITSRPDHWGSPISLKANDLLYDWALSQFGIEVVGILCQSMGGLSTYNWACRNPDRVVGIYGIYPVTNLAAMLRGVLGGTIETIYGEQGVNLALDLRNYDPIQQIASLCRRGVPAMHRHGDADQLVEYGANALEFSRAYNGLGGRLELITLDGLGHEAHPAFFKPEEVVGFMDSLDW